MNTRPLALVAALALVPLSGRAAMLRPFSQITAATVRLADLFDGLPAAQDRVLGAAPLPGTRIVVPAAQLAAIARDFDVAWRPASGAEQAVIERRGDTLPRAAIADALRQALQEAGAPADCDVLTSDVPPIVIPSGSHAAPEISQLNYDPQGGHFTALLSVFPPDMPAVQLRVSGQAVPMVRTAVASRRLSPGSMVEDGDVQTARVRLASLRGHAPLRAEAALGLDVRHDVPAGQTLSSVDLVRPSLVARGALVRMRLDSDGIALTAQGVAAEAGGLGDRIRVENPVSHLMIDAEVTGAGEVRVAPGRPVVALVDAR